MGIVLILLLIFIFRKKAKYIYSAFFFLIFFSNGFISDCLWRILEHPWQRLQYSFVDSADGIVVLSGGGIKTEGDSKIIEWGDPDRFLAGIDLYRAKKSKRLIFTGGANPLNPGKIKQGDLYLNEAVSLGIPRRDIFTTYKVFNTLQEAKAIKELIDEKFNTKQTKIILVTSAFHMKRAKRIFEKEGINVLPYPVDFRSKKFSYKSLKNPLNWVPNSHYLNKNSLAIREIIGRIIYKF